MQQSRAGWYVDQRQPVNWSHPLNADLVGWWMALPNNPGGDTLFDLPGRYPVGLVNGPGWSDTSQTGRRLVLKLVAASTQYGTVASLPGAPTSTAQATWCGWVNAATVGAYRGVFNSRSGSLGQMGLILTGGAGNPVGTIWSNGSSEYDAATGLTLTAGAWHFVAGTLDGANSASTVYRSAAGGGPLSSASISNVTYTAQTLAGRWDLGRDAAVGGREWDGLLDDFRLYSRSLSAAELAAVQEQGVKDHPDTMRWLSTRAWSLPAAISAADTSFPQWFARRQQFETAYEDITVTT